MLTDLIGAALVSVALLGGLFGYPVLQIHTVRHMRGAWRVLALLPAVPMTLVLGATVVGFVQQANLWPLLLIFTAPVALVYLGVLALAHRLARR